MKTFFLVSFFVIYLAAFAICQESNVLIQGRVLNYQNSVLLEDMTDVGELSLVVPTQVAVPDSTGNFELRYTLKDARYFRFGRNILFLQPKDTLDVVVDFNYPEKSRFKGKNQLIQEYLSQTPFPQAGSYLFGGFAVLKSFVKTIDTLKWIKKNYEKRLGEFSKMPNEFIALEKVRIESDFLNSVYSMNVYFVYENKPEGDDLAAFKLNYKEAVLKYSNEMPYQKYSKEYLKLEVYRRVLPLLMKYTPKERERNSYWEDWVASKDILDAFRNTTSKDSLNSLRINLETIKNEEYRIALNENLQKLLLFNKGDSALSFSYENSYGEKVQLDEYKGKVIYIDFWATWCGPCLKEMPALMKLKQKYKNKEIVFLSISIDSNISQWKRYVENNLDKGFQGVVDRYSIPEYNIVGIPRALIINKEFKIEYLEGPLPSSDEIANILDRLSN